MKLLQKASKKSFGPKNIKSAALILGLCGVTLGASACGRASLNASFGQRFRTVQSAQAAAHPAHEPTVRGDEASRNIAKHYSTLEPTEGGAATGGGAPMQTAGVPPLH